MSFSRFSHRMTLTAALLVGAAVLFQTGCEEDASPTRSIESNDIIPLIFEHRWIYETSVRRNDSLVYNNTDTVEVDTSVLQWGGSRWLRYAGSEDIWYRNGVDGLWRLRFDRNFSDGFMEKIYGNPTRAGERWLVVSDQDSVVVVSISESVTVSAGTFENCYYHRFTKVDGSKTSSIWLKPGVGIVQESILEVVGNDTFKTARKLRVY